MYLTRKITALSYPVIGEKFGGKDHSTVINAEQRIEELMTEDHELSRTVESLKRRLRTGTVGAPTVAALDYRKDTETLFVAAPDTPAPSPARPGESPWPS